MLYEVITVKIPMTVETLHFQAEVTKLLDIVVHALYSQKDVFLRELVSNASDACDRLRYAAITEPALTEGRITSYNVCYTKLLRNRCRGRRRSESR